MIRNQLKRQSFFNAWQREIARAKGNAPAKPGPGWLQGEAAHRDLCTALFKDQGGNWIVCGMNIKGDPYYCDQCLSLLNKVNPIEQGAQHEG